MRFVAGQGAEAEHLVRGAAVAERHREEAGRGAVAKRLAALRRIAIGKKQAGALWRVAIGKMLLTREPIKNIIGKNLLAKAHKNLDFVLGKPENEGFGG